jgi:hypothetical protein
MTVGTFALVAALALAVIFTVAGLAKLTDRFGTREAVREFGGPTFLVPALALVLPLAELAVAGALVIPTTRFVGAVGALGLLAMFSAAIAASLARGKAPHCHCFGQLHSAPASWRTLVRNGLLSLIALGLVSATRVDAGKSPWGWISARQAGELGAIAGAIAVVALAAAIGTAFLVLTRAYGRLLVRLEATEQALQEAGIEIAHNAQLSELGLDPGTPAPQFAMQFSTAKPATRDELLAPGLPLLLVFTSPGCWPCHTLLPSLARWQHEFGDRLTVAVASTGEPEEIRRQEAEHGLGAMLLDTDLALSDAYLTAGTPSAVLIAPDGTIASYIAAGAEEIEALVDRVVEPLTALSERGMR